MSATQATQLAADVANQRLVLNAQTFTVPILVVGLTAQPVQTYTVSGAAVGMGVLVNARDTSQISGLFYGYVSSANTVTVSLPVLVALGVGATKTIDIHVFP